MTSEKKNVILACTGSVASVKVPLLIEELTNSDTQVNVQLITTENALHFFDAESLRVPFHRDKDEWTAWQKRGDPVLHIELRRWADVMLIAPLDANTLAKIANGICDNLLTCVVRAWDMQRPLLFATAMNTHMWNHPITAKHITVLKDLGYQEIPCIEKTLMCGDTGFGGMAEVPTIVSTVMQTLKRLNEPT